MSDKSEKSKSYISEIHFEEENIVKGKFNIGCELMLWGDPNKMHE